MVKNNPVLVERTRGDVVESYHRGIICMVDEQNKVIFSVGDVEQICYPRSALKLIQVLPVIESGAAEAFGFTMEEIAIMCGSHNGEPEHLRVVHNILEKIGLHDDQLGCGPQLPNLKKDYLPFYKEDKEPKSIHNNCSGKHAGFLALCKYFGHDTRDYLSPKHPVQQLIKKTVAEMIEAPEDSMHVAIDGCSAPIFSMTVKQQAISYKNLTMPGQFNQTRANAVEMVVKAVTNHPFMVAGTKRYCTEMMELFGSRIFGKTGADSIFSMGFIGENWGCTIKMEDGRMGPQYNVAHKIIEATGIFPKEDINKLGQYVVEPILNWNKIQTGVVKVSDIVIDNIRFSIGELKAEPM